MESAEGSNNGGRRRSASERKSVNRRSRSMRRKSGPKSVDLETNRQEGREGRRRMSGTHRRDSRNKATARRRERSELRPPLGAHPGIGRASLPARLSAPGVVAPARPEVEVDDARKADEGGVVAMQQDNPEEEGEEEKVEEGRWTPEMVEEAARGVLGEDRQLQLRYVRWLRVVLSLSDKPPAGEVVAAGLVPRLLGFLREKAFPELLPEALCALTNIASTKHARAVVQEPEALPSLMALLGSSDPYVREQSAWCLGNIAGDCTEMRDLVLAAGAMQALIASLSLPQNGSESFTRTGTWALNNLCRGVPPPPLSTTAPVLPVVRSIVEAAGTSDEGALIDAGWVLYHITRGGSDRIEAVLSAGMLSIMPDLLLHENPQVARPVLRAMDNLACSSGAYREALIAAGVLDPLVETLGHDSSKVRADALRLLSCIAAGSPDQVAAVASTADLIPSIITELEEGNSLCRREAGWVFVNICECGAEPHKSVIPEMVELGVISAVCHNLDKEADPEILMVMLSLLFTILDEGGRGEGEDRSEQQSAYMTLVEESDGFDRTMALMNDHDDMEVYDKAMDIVRCFVDREEDQDYASENNFVGISNPRSEPPHNDSGSDSDADDSGEDMSGDSLSDDSFHPELGGGASGPITPPPKHSKSESEPETSQFREEPPQQSHKSEPKTSQFCKETPQTRAAASEGIWGAQVGRDDDPSKPTRQPLGTVPGSSSQGNGAHGSGGAGVREFEAGEAGMWKRAEKAAVGVGCDAERTE